MIFRGIIALKNVFYDGISMCARLNSLRYVEIFASILITHIN